MKVIQPLLMLVLLSSVALFSCKGKRAVDEGVAFNASEPIRITSFKPDSGGIATSMIIEGENFGTDVNGLTVYFVDSLGVKHRGGLVSSNGNRLYLTVPKLTYLRTLNIVVERNDGTNVYEGKAENMPFIYKTEVAVATVVGQPSTDHNLPTVGGNFSSATLSAPAFVTLDDEDNIFIVERKFDNGPSAKNDKRQAGHGGYASNLLMADTKNQEVTVLRYLNYEPLNAPTFSDEVNEEAIYIPEDQNAGYLRLRKGANYAVQRQSMLFPNADQNPFARQSNWKHNMVINKKDKMLYTILYRGELVRINPKTRQSELLIKKVTPDIPNSKGDTGSDAFYIFSPIEPNVMYVALTNYNSIRKIDLDKIPKGDVESYRGEDYAGLAITDGPVAGRGWEDGPLKMAKFNSPRQLAFTADGKLYIADEMNHCIRVIDTTVPADQAIVNTAVGIPGSYGFRDGGPDQALFNRPIGVAVTSDGTELYVADYMNHVVRKLAIQ